MTMKFGKCNLCLETKQLLNESHIVPKFMYSGMFDEHHRMFKASRHSKYEEIMQDGVKDGGILCMNCDKIIIGQLETYGKTNFFERIESSPCIETVAKSQFGGNLTFRFLNQFNYNKIKLLFLSIFWRAHISTSDFFKNCDLEENAETLRTLLLNRTWTEKTVFPINLFTLKFSSGFPPRILTPVKTMFGTEIRLASIIVGSLGILLNLSSSVQFVKDPRDILQDNGEVMIQTLDEIQTKMFLRFFQLE